MENFFGLHPPYDFLSVPVLTGTVGGAIAVPGCIGLLALKRRSGPDDRPHADGRRVPAVGTIVMVTGLLVLSFRTTVAFGPLLVVHLSWCWWRSRSRRTPSSSTGCTGCCDHHDHLERDAAALNVREPA